MEDRERLAEALADRYHIEREIGSGGMATVYLATDIRHERKVALKVLRSDLAASLGAERFLQEVRVTANLTHPHILPLHDSGEADGFLFFVMPYIEGESLRERLVREHELPVVEAARLLRDVVDALAAAHKLGVVHRDIKPENVLISGRHAMVADFGVAKAVSEATGRHKLTTVGVALGTPSYMAPEQAAADETIDHRADIYAVGAMAYELLTGRPPFTGGTPQQILAAQVMESPQPVTELRASVPPALETLIMRCLEKKPADRWQSAEEMLPHLEAAATPSGGITPTDMQPVSRPPTVVRSGVGKWLAGAAGLVVVGVLGVMSPRWFGGGREEGESLGGLTETSAGTEEVAVDTAAQQSIRLAVLPFEARGTDPDLATWGELAAEAITREVDRSQIRDVIPHSTVRSAVAAAPGESPAAMAAALAATRVLTGAVTRVGREVRFDMELIRADGSLVRSLDPVSGPTEPIQETIDLVAERAGGAILALTDTEWPGMALGTMPPSMDAYHSLAAAWEAWSCQFDFSAVIEILEPVLAERPEDIPSLLLAYWGYTIGGVDFRDRRDEAAERLRALLPRMTSIERAMFDFMGNQGAARIDAARRAFQEDPAGWGLALAFAAMELLRYDLAMEGFQAVDWERRCAPVEAWGWRAHLHHMRGDHAEELRWVRHGLERFPDNATLRVSEARALVGLDSLEAVREAVERLKILPGGTPGTRVGSIATELMVHGHTTLGEEYQAEALELLADIPGASLNEIMTRDYYRRDWEALLPLAEEGIAEFQVGRSQRANAEYYRIQALVGLGRVEEAEAAQAWLVENYPDNRIRVALPLALGDARGVTAELSEVLENGGRLEIPGNYWLHLSPEWQPMLENPVFQAFVRQVSAWEGG